MRAAVRILGLHDPRGCNLLSLGRPPVLPIFYVVTRSPLRELGRRMLYWLVGLSLPLVVLWHRQPRGHGPLCR